jgi:hypothetical protein
MESANKQATAKQGDVNIENFDQAQAYMDKHTVGAAPGSHFDPGGKFHFTAVAAQQQPTDVLNKICGGYQLLKPVLGWVIKLFPAKWGISKWFALLDQICAGTGL